MAFISLLLFLVIVSNASYCQSPPPTNPYVYVLVWHYHPDLYSGIITYKDDLENAGFSVEIRVWPEPPLTWDTNATIIRQFLRTEAETHEIAGALLVGDVPYANYEMEYAGSTRIFPCDLYYMDLDGNWTDSDGNGVYDMHTNETGGLEPEIWVGRLWASTMTGDEDELLINYFDKNHRFRTGNLTLPRRAIVYLDDEFVYNMENVNSSLSMIYGNETTLVIDPNTTNATDYKNRLNDTLGYEWLHLVAHGNFKKHGFKITQDGRTLWTEVFSSEIRNIDPHVFFYNIMACGTADYTDPDYIGGSYLFADTYGLLVVGSTKIHHVWNVRDFYEPIAKGKCIGQAFKEWLEKNGELNRFTAYGLTILGDPTLRTPRIYNQTRDVAVTSVMTSEGATEVRAGSHVTINVTLKNEGVFVETVNITVYYNCNIIGKQTVNLFPEADRTLIFIWNTTGVPCGNYTLSATATPVPGETDTTDNTYPDGWVLITRIGDVNGDGVTNVIDIILCCISMGPVTPANIQCDVNGDGEVNVQDIILCCINMG